MGVGNLGIWDSPPAERAPVAHDWLCAEPDTACTCELIRRVRDDTVSSGRVARASRDLAHRAYANGYQAGRTERTKPGSRDRKPMDDDIWERLHYVGNEE
jgi:ribosome modulation factor